MPDGVVVEYNTETGEAIVETTDAISRRYCVPMSAVSFQATRPKDDLAVGRRQGESGCIGRCGAKYADNLFSSLLVGRCVTIEPVDQVDAAPDDGIGSLTLFPARLVQMHEAGSLISKSMLPGTITRVSGHFVFIFSSFIPYEAVATREVFLTGDSLVDVVHAQIDNREEEEWVGRLVRFALYPMSFRVMEAFFACTERPQEREKASHTISTRSHSGWSHPSCFSRPAFDKQRRTSGGATFVQHETLDDLNGVRLGSWRVTGTDPCYFFHPELSVEFKQGTALLPRNAVPPMLYQKSSFSIQLWCFWMLPGTQVSLHVLDEYCSDVTDRVLCIEKEEITERTVVMLDHLESRKAITFENKIKSFKMEDVVCEINFLLCIKLGGYEAQLESKTVFVRQGPIKPLLNVDSTAGSPLQKRDVLSQKFWISDFLGPEDNISGGFTDPGRSNELLTGDCYDEWPMLEREIIVVDPEDRRLQALAAAARRAASGIVDTIVYVQALTWLVASAYGGESGGVRAEDEIITLRQQKRVKKRQRGGLKRSEATNVVRLGDICSGVCRHRALLFKYLCDVVRVPCYLMRGEHKGPNDSFAERHTWNIVPLEGRRHLLVDATLSPHKLEMWPIPGYSPPPVRLSTDWSASHCLILFRSAVKIHLLEECGRGATAVVRRGVLGGGFTCVVKVPRKGSDIESLVHEYDVLRKFRGASHVVRCLGWSGGIVMEYFPTNLLNFMNHLITCEKRMSRSQQKEVLIGLLTALKEVHNRGYVHRDIKAENILVVVIRCSKCHSIGSVCHLCDVRVKLGDFADSVMVNTTTLMYEASPRIGTPPYTAPEIEFEMPFSFAADIWSCGILAIEMVLMRLPSANMKGKRVEVKEENCNDVHCDDFGRVTDAVPVLTDDGITLGHVCVPCLPRNLPLLRWQREFVEGSLQVNWRQRLSAGVLLDMLNNAVC